MLLCQDSCAAKKRKNGRLIQVQSRREHMSLYATHYEAHVPSMVCNGELDNCVFAQLPLNAPSSLMTESVAKCGTNLDLLTTRDLLPMYGYLSSCS